MEDLFQKFGMIFIAVIVVLLLITFAMKHVFTIRTNLEHEQFITGTHIKVVEKINQLCVHCLKEKNIEKDCFILHVKTDNDLDPNLLGNSISLLNEINSGEHTLKIKVSENTCQVVKLV